MCSKQQTISFLEHKKEHILYNLSIQNIQERKRKAIILYNAQDVAVFLGVTVEKVFKNRYPGKTITSCYNNQCFAIRLRLN